MNVQKSDQFFNTPIGEISYGIANFLKECLMECEGWKVLAESFGIFSKAEIEQFNQDVVPAGRLLDELSTRLCTVGILAEKLRYCKLYMALYAICGPEPLVIVKQPWQNGQFGFSTDDARERIMTIPFGCTLRLECKAEGLPPPVYAWFRDNEELLNQTEEILEVKAFGPQHVGEYCCRIAQKFLQEGTIVEVTSDPIEVDLMPQLPEIDTQPKSVTCREGSTAVLTFSLKESPAIGELHFQWFRYNQSLTGCTSQDLEINCVCESDEGDYRCYVTSKAGEVWTDKATIMVYGPPDSLIAKEKFALLIGNDEYENHDHLNTPSSDVATLSNIFTELQFKVVALKNLTLKEMRNALKHFCEMLPPDAYAIFYFVGHGFEIQDKYMLPVDAPGSSHYLRRHSLCEREVIKEVFETHPGLVVIILDMCLRVPDSKENPGIHKEVPPVYEYTPGKRNLVKGYATTSNLGAYERSSETNGIYAKHLAQALSSNHDLPIVKVLEKVNEGVANEAPDAAEKQMPCVSHNLASDFWLSGDIEGNMEAALKYSKLIELPTDNERPLELVFNKVRVQAKALLKLHMDTFLNSLDVYIIGVTAWNVDFHVQNLELKLESQREQEGWLVTIHNLQKLKGELSLSVALKDMNNMMVDHTLLDLRYIQLVCAWQLWHAEEE
ncbi:mucosa-associated lymphoid tissue lymphoma translocation protein 1-like [Hetaerina americana]|uniref:mucosa-associated lymphoid tissue lymphoma translocation protein 1-like n=1 Tax=Hetaerina americana TaxID=62018 RepID=UPI003A7F1793